MHSSPFESTAVAETLNRVGRTADLLRAPLHHHAALDALKSTLCRAAETYASNEDK